MRAVSVPTALVLSCLLVSTAGFLLGQAAVAAGWQVIPAVASFGALIAVAAAVASFARSTSASGEPFWREWR
jgi:hypothetical protein